MNHELKEWLGLTRGDLAVVVAAGAVYGMYRSKDPGIDAALAALALCLSVLGCYWGMPADPKLSRFTNGAKLVAYPLSLLVMIGLTFLNFYTWNR